MLINVLFIIFMIIFLYSCAVSEGEGNSYPQVVTYSPKSKEVEVQFMGIASFSLKCTDRETPEERIVYRAYLDGVIKCDSAKKMGGNNCRFYDFMETTGISFQYQFSEKNYEHTVKLTCSDEPVGGYPARTVEKVWKVKVKDFTVPLQNN